MKEKPGNKHIYVASHAFLMARTVNSLSLLHRRQHGYSGLRPAKIS